MERQINFYEYFKSEPNIINLSRFERHKQYLKSTFDYDTPKGVLNFEVYIPLEFPQGRITFVCKSILGYEHQGTDQSLCLNDSPSRDPKLKLFEVFRKYHKWVEKFFIHDENDSRYEHPQFVTTPMKDTMIFSEDVNTFTQNRFMNRIGRFKFSKISQSSNSFIIKSIGEYEINWSQHYKELTKEFNGFYVIIDEIPTKQRKQRITTWDELLRLLPENFCTEFLKFITQNSSLYSYGDFFYLIIGYIIPTTENFIIQWDLILFPKNKSLLKSLKKNETLLNEYKEEIKWGRTFNASYENLIGRGSFSDKITNAKILIIGLGAIGSNLAVSLARGGAKNLTLMDYDEAEPGNEVRSVYDFTSVGNPKVDELYNKLIAISPYVEVTKINGIFNVSRFDENFEKYKLVLNNFDLIFDCTASMDTTCRLENMDLGFKVITFSITNEAKEFMCITGAYQLSLEKEKILRKLGEVEKDDNFYPSPGCWHSTFKANNANVNTLLCFAISEIDYRFKKDIPLRSFIIRNNKSGDSVNFNLEYVTI